MLTSKGIAVWLEYEDSAIHLPHLKPVSYVENETSFTTAKIPTTQNRFTVSDMISLLLNVVVTRRSENLFCGGAEHLAQGQYLHGVG